MGGARALPMLYYAENYYLCINQNSKVMKRIALFIVALFVCMSSFAQLEAQKREDFADYRDVMKYTNIASGAGYYIRYIGEVYYLFGVSSNQFENKMPSIRLGKTKEEAILTLTDLKELPKTIGKQELVIMGYDEAYTTIWNNGLGAIAFRTQRIAGATYCIYYLNLKKATKMIQEFVE